MTKIGTKCPSWLPIIVQQPIFKMLSFLSLQNAPDDLVEDGIAEELPSPTMVPRPHGVLRPLPYQGQNPMASYQHHQQPQGGYQVCHLTPSNYFFLGGGNHWPLIKRILLFSHKAAPLHWSWTIDGLWELKWWPSTLPQYLLLEMQWHCQVCYVMHCGPSTLHC